MPKALQHNYPGWQDDPHAEDSNGESREVWFGAMRVVSARRARKLRKRGVPLMPLHAVHTVTYSTPCGGALRVRIEPTTPNGRARYAWFECKDDAERRIGRRRLQCYMTATQADPNTLGRKVWLRMRLAQMRREHTHAAFWRRPRANPQLDLYAAAFRSMRETERVATEWGGATPEQLEAAKAVDMSDFHEGLKRAKLAEWERTRYAKPLLDPSYAGAPHLDCDCMACRPYTG